MTITAEKITGLHYFSEIEQSLAVSFAQLFTEKSLTKGQMVVNEGEYDDNLHFVGYGVVKAYKTSSDGKEQIIKLIRPGESINDICVYSSGVNPFSVQTLGDVKTISIHRKDLLPLLKNNWAVASIALRSVAEQSRLLLNLIEDLSFKNVTGRVAKILIQNSTPGPDGFPRLTQYEMAAMAGTAREVVGRSLKTLEESGAIKLERHRIIISNRKNLERIAGLN